MGFAIDKYTVIITETVIDRLQSFAMVLSVLLFLLLAVSAPSLQAAHEHAEHSNVYEKQLIYVLNALRQNRIVDAEQLLARLIDKKPNFKLARLLQADILSAKAGQISYLGNATKYNNQFSVFRDEAEQRWKHYLSRGLSGDQLSEQSHDTKIPSSLLELDSKQRYVLVADMQHSRLYLYENQPSGLHLVNDFYISIGLKGARKVVEGDQKTPVGVYFVDSFIPDNKLPDLYGAGAFPINYPNEWDVQRGKTGYGIWLHGTPSYTFNRPPLASDGCVVVSNLDFMTISSYIDVGQTPVIIAENISWIEPKAIAEKRDQLRLSMNDWKHDWESRDMSRYLSHYSKDFFGKGKDYNAWRDNAYNAYADTDFIQVTLSNVSMFEYPDEALVVTTFRQEYKSSNVLRHSTKRQYWRFESNEWKIIYEGSI